MNDDITTLRLELCRERDRANALEAALTKAVQELIAKAVHDYAALKVENERLRKTLDVINLGYIIDPLKVASYLPKQPPTNQTK